MLSSYYKQRHTLGGYVFKYVLVFSGFSENSKIRFRYHFLYLLYIINHDILIIRFIILRSNHAISKFQSRYHINDIWAIYQLLAWIWISGQRVIFLKIKNKKWGLKKKGFMVWGGCLKLYDQCCCSIRGSSSCLDFIF